MSTPLPSLESLRCFRAAAALLNFRAAARTVALTPAAFGQRIAQLEDQLGTRLFERTTRSVALTTAGLALVPFADRALEAAQACVHAARGERGPAPAEIVLGTRHELGMSWVYPQRAALARDLPHVTVHLYFGSGDDLIARVRLREIDCAVTSTRYADPRLDALPLHREEYAFVGATKMLRAKPLRAPAQALEHTLLDAGAELPLFRYFLDAPGGRPDLRFGRVVRLGTIEAIARGVLDGEGVAVLPRYYVSDALAKRSLTELFPKVAPAVDHFRLVFRIDDPRRALFERVAEALRSSPLK